MLLSSEDNDDENKIKPVRASHIVLTSRVITSTAANLLKQSPLHLVVFNFKLLLSDLESEALSLKPSSNTFICHNVKETCQFHYASLFLHF